MVDTMCPFRDTHSCMLNADATGIAEVRSAKTKWGLIQIVMAKDASGKLVARSMKIPGNVPVRTAKSLCQSRGGKFEPATPLNPRKQLLSESDAYGYMLLSDEEKREVMSCLVRDFEMPNQESEIELAKWRAKSVNDLPDSAFIVILPGGKKDETGKTVPRSKRLLPYKNASGKIDKAHVQNALARVNQISASASVKRRALGKLLRIARALGMKVQEKGKFKLSDLDFYLSVLEKLEGE